ncbi:MAG: glycosyltransferase family 4 protein, partial [Solirubrobacteraceae bacterium]
MWTPPSSVLLGTPLWGRNGGVAAHVLASARLLAENGSRVTVLAERVDATVRVPGVSVYSSSKLFDRDAPPEERLGDALSACPDVIHLHQLDHPELVVALRAHAPVLVSAHAYTACASGLHYFRPGHECTRSHGPGCLTNMALRGCAHVRNPRPLPGAYRRAGRGLEALRAADLAVAYSDVVERHLATNGVARRATVPLFSTMTPSQGHGHESRRRVVFAGRIVKPKGLAVLISAAVHVQGEFVICGDGFQARAMRALARRLGVERRVHFRGWLDEQALAQELADASVVAVPSLWPEPFGLVGIEALAAGRPVIASATGGIGEWLHEGRTGLSVQPGDPKALARALGALLEDPARQHAMGLAGKQLVAERFSPERHVEALLRAYDAARSAWELGQGGANPATAPI